MLKYLYKIVFFAFFLSSCGQNHHITGSNSEVSQPSVNVLDADQDGILNSMDADCDNDGIIDTNEIGLPPNANFNSINNGGSRPWLGNTSTNVSISTNTAYSATGSGTTFTLPNGRTVSYSSVRRLDKIRNSSFTFTFDSPIKANEFAFQIIDINNLGAPQLTVSVVTGDATTSDFTIVQSASSSVLSYNSTTGVISRSAGSARQHGVLVGLNEKTIQQMNITLTGAGSGDFIAYNLISIEHGNLDTDLDQINDLCDLDSDNDGISDFTESGFLFTNADTNSDGFISKSESLAWLKLNVNPGITSGDANGDGLMDIFDVAYNTLLASGTFGTAPANNNTNNIPNLLDLDSDGDTIPDATEARATSNYVAYPLTIDSTADSDGDGILNIYDNFGGFGSTNSLFITGINFPYLEANDALDSIPDYLDLDSDGDGINDQIEAGVITVPPSYSDPDGSVNDPIGSSDGLENSDSDPTDIDFRSL